MKLSVILPAYNEERTIRTVLDAVLGIDLSGLPERVEKEIIVVDDASTDRTAEIIASEARVKLVRHKRNRGKGAAIRTALAHATGDVVLIQDADLEYSVSDYAALLRPFLQGGVDVVYGSRFLARRTSDRLRYRRPRNMRWRNLLANRVLTFLANLLYGARISDEATCFKVFRTALLKSLPLRARGFDFCPEVTALVCLSGRRIREVPIAYTARTRKEGKKVKWLDAVQAVKTLCLYRIEGGRMKADRRADGQVVRGRN